MLAHDPRTPALLEGRHCADCYAVVPPHTVCPCWKDRLTPDDRQLMQLAIVARWEERWKAIDIKKQQIAAATLNAKWGAWGNRNAVGGRRRRA